jgi:hypothetical protein
MLGSIFKSESASDRIRMAFSKCHAKRGVTRIRSCAIFGRHGSRRPCSKACFGALYDFKTDPKNLTRPPANTTRTIELGHCWRYVSNARCGQVWRRHVSNTIKCLISMHFVQGDWKWLKETFMFQYYANNNICHICTASKTDPTVFYTQCGADAGWQEGRRSHQDWQRLISGL